MTRGMDMTGLLRARLMPRYVSRVSSGFRFTQVLLAYRVLPRAVRFDTLFQVGYRTCGARTRPGPLRRVAYS